MKQAKTNFVALCVLVVALLVTQRAVAVQAAPLGQGSYTISGVVRDAGFHGVGNVKVEVRVGDQTIRPKVSPIVTL